jgi:hypothetical protein
MTDAAPAPMQGWPEAGVVSGHYGRQVRHLETYPLYPDSHTNQDVLMLVQISEEHGIDYTRYAVSPQQLGDMVRRGVCPVRIDGPGAFGAQVAGRWSMLELLRRGEVAVEAFTTTRDDGRSAQVVERRCAAMRVRGLVYNPDGVYVPLYLPFGFKAWKGAVLARVVRALQDAQRMRGIRS